MVDQPKGDGDGAPAGSSLDRTEGPVADPVLDGLPVWTDRAPPAGPRDSPTITAGPELQHEHRLQKWVLGGLGGAFVITLGTVVAGSGMHWISEDFAKTIAQTILPAILASAGTIVGTLFGHK
jgi:hypothetical protein